MRDCPAFHGETVTADLPLPLHLHRDIEPGEIFRQDGSVVVHGNVGAGARIEITNGGFEITGDVGDDVHIRTRCDGAQKIGIRIEGVAGHDVTLDSNQSVSLNGAGDRLRIRGKAPVSLGHVGDSLNVSAASTVTGGNVGRNAWIRAGCSCHLGQVGHGSIILCDSVIQFTSAGHDCLMVTKESAYGGSIGAGTNIEAEDHVQLRLAHTFSTVTAHSVTKGAESGNAAAFELLDDKKWRQAFSARHFRPPQP